MTEQERIQERNEKVKQLYSRLRTTLFNLYDRWQDEKDYEDIKDYGEVIKPKVVEVGAEFIKMTPLPFGFTFRLDGAVFQIKVTATRYSCKRIR